MVGKGPSRAALASELSESDENKARELVRYVERGQYVELTAELEQVLAHADALIVAHAFRLLGARRIF